MWLGYKWVETGMTCLKASIVRHLFDRTVTLQWLFWRGRLIRKNLVMVLAALCCKFYGCLMNSFLKYMDGYQGSATVFTNMPFVFDKVYGHLVDFFLILDVVLLILLSV
jgi:hypothetical protein